MKPTWIGSRRIWNAFTPTIAPARRSRTYAFMPWITATTAIRNATDTMMPSSVKNDRSLWLHTVCRAWRMASVNCMAGKLTVKEPGKGEGGRVVVRPFPFPPSPASYRLFISQCFHWVQPRGSTRRVQPEQDTRQGRHDQGHDDRRERHVRWNGRGEGQHHRRHAAADHAHHAADERERRRLDQKLPQDLAARGPQRLAHADPAGALGDRDH